MANESFPTSSSLSKTAAHWGTHRDQRATFWRGHPVIRRYVNRRISGDPDISALDYLARAYYPNGIDRGLSIACGHGGLERQIVGSSLARTMDGVDISPGAIASAVKQATECGMADRLHYFVDDFNAMILPAEKYDAVLSFSAAHHCENLEHLFAQIALSLKPDAYFALNEYVGPTRFQVSDRQLALMNRLLATLPEELRISIPARAQGKHVVKKAVHRIDPAELIARDPSEAVRSAEIRPLFDAYFELIEYRPWGGSLLHFMLSGIVGNFDESNRCHTAWLESAALFEETLEEIGHLESDCALLIGRKKSR